MVELDCGKRPAWLARFRALIAIGIVQIFILGSLGALYNVIAMSRGVVIHRSYLTQAQMLPYGLVAVVIITYVNAKVFAPMNSVEYYRTVFGKWSKDKRGKWKIYVVSLAVLAFVVCLLLGNTSAEMLQP
jgi:hypothetical protein